MVLHFFTVSLSLFFLLLILCCSSIFIFLSMVFACVVSLNLYVSHLHRTKQSIGYCFMLLAALENSIDTFSQQQKTLDDLVDLIAEKKKEED